MLHRDVALRDRDEAREARLGGQQVVAARVERAVGDPVADREQLPRGIEQEAELHRRERGSRPSASARSRRSRARAAPAERSRATASASTCASASPSAPPRRPARPCGGPGRGGPPRSGPAAQRGSASRRARARAPARRPRGAPRACSVATSRSWLRMHARTLSAQASASASSPSPSGSRQGQRDVGGGVRVLRELRETRGDARRDPRAARPSEAATVVERLVELPPGDGLRAAVAGERAQRLAGELHRVRDPGEPFGADQRAIDPLPARAGEGDQVPGEVAAVDRGDVAAARGAAGRGCRTSCRSGRGSARGGPSSSRVASRRSTASSVPSQPKSRAATTESR